MGSGMSGIEPVVIAGTAITFPLPFTSTDYSISIRCYDAVGDNIDFTLDNKAVDGFTITPARNGTVDYIASETATATIKELTANKALQLTELVGDPTAGSGTLNIYLWYIILEL